MKQIIITIGMAVIIMLVSLTLISVESKETRKEELNRGVAAAVKQTVSESKRDGQQSIKSNNDMVAQFVNTLCVSIGSDGDISVEVMGVNYIEGMLDVLVTESFNYPNGRNGKIRVRKCAIYDSN